MFNEEIVLNANQATNCSIHLKMFIAFFKQGQSVRNTLCWIKLNTLLLRLIGRLNNICFSQLSFNAVCSNCLHLRMDYVTYGRIEHFEESPFRCRLPFCDSINFNNARM